MLNNDKNGSMGGYSYITSRANPLIVATAALSEKKYRDRYGYFVFEGRKLFAEALSSEAEIVNVFICEDIPGNIVSGLPSDKVIVVNRRVYDKISGEKSPEGILCVAKHIDFLHKFVKIYNCNGKASGTKFMAVQIRDPGNLGTMIRNANALGIDELIISSDCADIYNRRTVRAAMGAAFQTENNRLLRYSVGGRGLAQKRISCECSITQRQSDEAYRYEYRQQRLLFGRK